MDLAGGLLGIVDSSLQLGTAIVQRMNLKDRQKYIDRVRQVKLDFMAEDALPDGTRSDRKLEDLRDLLQLETNTMNLAIAAGVTENK
jgi:hypothetical protein